MGSIKTSDLTALNFLKTQNQGAQLDNIAYQSVDLTPIFLDMHNDALIGRGYALGESGAYINKFVTQNVAKGTNWIYCDVTGFVANQLIVILGDDLKYRINYANYIDTTNHRIGLIIPLASSLTAGVSKVYNFYSNFAHPREVGYKALADYFIDKLFDFHGSLYLREYARNFTDIGTVTKSDGDTGAYGLQGGSQLAVKVSASEIGAGKKYSFTISEYSKYWKVAVNVSSATRNNIVVQLYDETNSTVIKQCTLDTVYGLNVEFFQYLTPGNYSLRIITNTASAVNFNSFYAEIYKYNYLPQALDCKTHIFLGDSWFNDTNYFIDRVGTYLPNATLLNFGIGGNAIQNLINRFTGVATDADKTGSGISDANWLLRKDATTIKHIDYVWIMCGTNDYLTNTTSTTFKAKLKELIIAISLRGAKPIILTSSVGDVNKNGGVITQNILQLSHQYADVY